MKSSSAPKNLTELFNRQGELYQLIEDKKIEVDQASAMTNAADKMIKIAALQASILSPEDVKKLEILK